MFLQTHPTLAFLLPFASLHPTLQGQSLKLLSKGETEFQADWVNVQRGQPILAVPQGWHGF